MIDWNVATSTGVRWARPGPAVSMAEARKVVAELRRLAIAVQEPVREVTQLPGLGDGGRIAVVDRPGWIRANVDGFRVVLEPLVEQMRERGSAPPPGSVIGTVGSRVTDPGGGAEPRSRICSTSGSSTTRNPSTLARIQPGRSTTAIRPPSPRPGRRVTSRTGSWTAIASLRSSATTFLASAMLTAGPGRAHLTPVDVATFQSII